MKYIKKNPNVVKILVILMFCVILFSIYFIKLNLESVDSVSRTTEELINVHIDGLTNIADLESLVNNSQINLYRYYANLDNKFYYLHNDQVDSIKTFIPNNAALFELGQKANLLNSLSSFEQNAFNFDLEMSKPGRDWDKLRSHLYASELDANNIVNVLTDIRTTLRTNLRQNSTETLEEITVLNNLQILFIIGSVLILTYVIFILYGHVKDKEKLYRLAYYDENSGLPNKASFEQKSTHLTPNKLSSQQGLFVVHLDRYKLITGRFGYVVGERLIEKLSTWLKNTVEQHDNHVDLYKFTSFSWLIHIHDVQADEQFFAEFADKLLQVSASLIEIDKVELRCSFSIGIAITDDKEKQKVDLIREADAALNASLQQGGACFNIYTQEMGDKIKQFVDIEHALSHAIERQELSLFYQPKINSRTGEIACSEALLRWVSNDQMISPGVFIPIAEKSGLIIRIGEWVLEQSCQQWVEWYQQGLKALPIAVNISAMQFHDPDFPQLVKKILAQSNMPASMLELEITEEAAAADPVSVINTLNQLKQIGVSIAIDDFGTGYSSLSYLKRFPIDTLKIDQSFIRDMHISNNDSDIVKLIVDLAKKLNFKVVAEGVETEEQHQQLKAWGCDYLQGYLFSKPVKAGNFTELLKSLNEQ